MKDQSQSQSQSQVAAKQRRPAALTPPFNFSRRYACDRCRGHKLRCVRDQMTTSSPCQRCRKAREKCTIGSSILSGPSLGRPALMAFESSVPNATTSPSANTESARLVLPQESWDSMDSVDRNNDVNWLDMLGPTCAIPCELDPTPPVSASASGGDGDDTDMGGGFLTITPTNQNTTTAGYSFIPAPCAFDFAPVLDVSEDRDTRALGEASRNMQMGQQHHQQHNQNTPYHGDDPISNSSARAHEHTPALNLANRLTASKGSPGLGSSERANSSKNSNQSPTELKDATIQQLSDLSTSLMKDLHRIVDCKIASSFLLTHSDKGPAEYLFKTLDGAASQENAVGRMLQGSERFLEIMQLFKELSHPTCSVPENASGESVLSLNGLRETFESSEGDNEAKLERRWKVLQSYLERQNPIPTTLDSDFLGVSQKPDITSKLAVLTCYMCLLRIYETVFFVIHHSLEYAPSFATAIKIPQTMPGLAINGFMLHKHRHLQIQILIQVSTYMLESVEKSMHFLLTDATFQSLLNAVLQQEGLECSPGNETGMSSVRRLIEKVKKMKI